MRILVFSQDKPVINKQFKEADLSGGSVTIEGVPVGTVDIYAVANEAALGKDYSDMADFEDNLVQVGNTKKALVMDEHRTHFPKRFTEQEIAQHGLPMSWHRDVQIIPSDGTPQTIEVELERSVAKLNVIMNNTLSHPITITSMTFGEFFGDRLYLFREQTLDVPDDTEYDVQNYESLSVEIGGYGSKTLALYIYPSYAWTDAHPTLRGFRPNGPVIRNIYSVGAPSIILNSIGSVMTFGMNQILFAFSSTAVAVFNVYFKLQSFVFMPVFGLNNGMVPIIAYNYGAKKPERNNRTQTTRLFQ